MPHRTRRRVAAGVALLLVAWAGVACADGAAGDPDTPPAPDAPVTTTAAAPGDTEAGNGGSSSAPPPADSVQPPAAAAVRGGTLRIAGEAAAGSPWTPADVLCDSYCLMRIRTVIEPLAVVDQDLQVQPFLAESITPNADFSAWDITVRAGVFFTDGTPLDADAVIANLQATWRGPLVSAAMRDVARVGGDPDGPLLITKTSDHSLRVRLGRGGDPTQPLSWPSFPYALTLQAGLIASPTWLDAVEAGTADATAMVGTGPFLLEEYTDGGTMTVSRNPTYWLQAPNGDQLPYLDRVEFVVIDDAKEMADALRTGSVDLIATSDGANINSFAGDDSYPTELFATAGETSYVLFHLTQPGLDDQRVRCALNQAVDKQALIDTVYGGGLDVANGPFSPGQEGHLADNGSLPYDPDAARALIDDYIADTGQTPHITYSTTLDSNHLLRAQFLQRAWEAVGVEVDIDQTEQSVFVANALIGSPEFGAFGWRQHAGLTVDMQMPWWHSAASRPDGEPSPNFGRLDDPVIDDLLAKARSEADPDVRREYAEDINRRFAERCWILPLWFTRWGIIHTPHVTGFGTSPLPDGAGTLRDGAGAPGQIWLQGVFLTG